jgi:uncharacterized protein YybS (DUF2232 family)
MAVTLALQLSALSLLAQMQNGLLVVAGSVLAFLVPWPVAWLTLRRGAVPGIVATGLVALVLAWAGGPLVGGFYLVQFGIGSVAVSLMLRSGRSWDQAVGAGAGISVSGLACGLCVAAAMQGGHPLAMTDSWARAEVERAVAALQTSGMAPELARQGETLIRELGDKLVQLYPAMVIVVIGAVMLVLAAFLMRYGRQRGLLMNRNPFQLWKVPENLIWTLIGSGAGVLFLDGPLQRVAWNLVIVVLTIYFMQGVAIMRFFFEQKRVAPVLRSVGYFLVVASYPLRILVTGVGVFDLWIDFRKPRIRKD